MSPGLSKTKALSSEGSTSGVPSPVTQTKGNQNKHLKVKIGGLHLLSVNSEEASRMITDMFKKDRQHVINLIQVFCQLVKNKIYSL